MKKSNIVKKNEDFRRIILNNKPIKMELFNIYKERTNEETYRFGISVSKKVGNAVTRNKLKRQLKSIIDKKNYQNGFNCIIIIKRAIILHEYVYIENQLNEALEKLEIIEGAKNEK